MFKSLVNGTLMEMTQFIFAKIAPWFDSVYVCLFFLIVFFLFCQLYKNIKSLLFFFFT